ncbi:hypothetical protein TVAG_495580 [Trichomonas vaginalis G3]|uniref:PA14 domain-containing protein n=1 Tax=Trichomonas vaginalis (strain ATCC PRA-98 / G3) TaxID=412133 RepID=A2DVK1_TRIV3|nr:teneurin transmembrane protein family [Trichomonas vaginalis G3]EAY15543.1 hypothetical protein TVAG_495580 [Trichomonas vaginalis G3]KAI5526189.1 teneurin transmembrane protein family [Trichomonas vaginalis G3]|eukprot:XP_001327766.1 hypothetical protein [Trichomonas vaginalis G3]
MLRNFTKTKPTPWLVTGYFNFTDSFRVNNGQTSNLYGSFCPPTTGKYIFNSEGADWVGGSVNNVFYGYDYRASAAWCYAAHVSESSNPIPLEKGRCYQFHSWSCADTCGGDIYHYARYRTETTTNEFVNSYLSYDCVHNDCDIGYVGSSCTPVDLDCNGNGVPSDGLTGDINTCVCTNGLEPFCDDLTTVPSGHVDPKMQFTYGKIIESETSAVFGDVLEYSSSYANYTIKGTIRIPQNGQYSFRIKAHTDVKLEIADINVNLGSIDYKKIFNCQEDDPVEYETGKMALTKGEHQFTITGISGCAIEDQWLSFEWMFYRYYISKNTTPEWTYIPRRYLTAPK